MRDQFNEGRMLQQFVLIDRRTFEFPHAVEFRLIARQRVAAQDARKMQVPVFKKEFFLLRRYHADLSDRAVNFGVQCQMFTARDVMSLAM